MANMNRRRPFSRLGDQQLLDQTRRLAANERALEVHILDHLAEIDRRGLALRRGYSSLFDYAVRELEFSDAAAQRRIQTMRLCRRHDGVRAKLLSGKLNLTSVAQLETTFASAERQWRKRRRPIGMRQPDRNGGSPDRRPQDVREPEPVAPASDGAEATAATVMPAPRPAATSAAALAAADPHSAESATPAVPSAADRDGVGVSSTPPSAAEAHPGEESATVAAAVDEPKAIEPAPPAMLDPHRQRELINQACGLSTRQLAGLIAETAPDSARPRDTLRAVGTGRYTLKVSIDENCERELRQLKGLLSHLDPRMSWGDLIARLVHEAVERHDPRRGGRRRKRASPAGEPPEPKQAAVRTTGLIAKRRADRGETCSAQKAKRLAAARQPVAETLIPSGAPDRQDADRSVPASSKGDAAATAAAATTPAPESNRATAAQAHSPATCTPDGAARRQRPTRQQSSSTAGDTQSASARDASTSAREPAPGVPPERGSRYSGAGEGDHHPPHARDSRPAQRADAPEPHAAPGRSLDRRTRANIETDAIGTAAPKRRAARRAIPAAVRRLVWKRDEGRCRYRDPLTGRRCNSSYLLQIDHILPVAQGGGAEPGNLRLACFAHHRLRHRDAPAPQPEFDPTVRVDRRTVE